MLTHLRKAIAPRKSIITCEKHLRKRSFDAAPNLMAFASYSAGSGRHMNLGGLQHSAPSRIFAYWPV